MPARPAGERYFDEGPYFGLPLGEMDNALMSIAGKINENSGGD